jgi:hypothetical protein
VIKQNKKANNPYTTPSRRVCRVCTDDLGGFIPKDAFQASTFITGKAQVHADIV